MSDKQIKMKRSNAILLCGLVLFAAVHARVDDSKPSKNLQQKATESHSEKFETLHKLFDSGPRHELLEEDLRNLTDDDDDLVEGSGNDEVDEKDVSGSLEDDEYDDDDEYYDDDEDYDEDDYDDEVMYIKQIHKINVKHINITYFMALF